MQPIKQPVFSFFNHWVGLRIQDGGFIGFEWLMKHVFFYQEKGISYEFSEISMFSDLLKWFYTAEC